LLTTESSPQKAREILERGFKADADLMKDLGTLTGFVAVASSGGALGTAAALALVLETAGAAIAAATTLIDRLRGGRAESENLSSYERFTALLYLTAVRSYLEELEQRLGDLASTLDETGDAATPTAGSAALLTRVRAVDESAISYLIGTEPLREEAELFLALDEWLITLLSERGVAPDASRELVNEVDAGARTRFHVFLASDNAEAIWMHDYLALRREAAQETALSDLRAATMAIAGWLDPAADEVANSEAWATYRDFLRGLPDVSSTMYGEDFGVSKVFQSPRVKYHIALSKPKDDAETVVLDDVGRLLGALVSNRVPGNDIIVLAGGPGSGKSTLCRVFASELAKSAEAHPIFLQLRRLREGDDIPQFLEQQLVHQGLVTRLADLLALPNVVVILDGFDELVGASRSRLRQFFNVLRDDMETGALRNAKVIVSGRDTLFPGGRGLPTGSHVVSLEPLDRTRVTAWGAKWRAQHTSGHGCSFHPELLLADELSPTRGPAAVRRAGANVASVPPLHHLVTWPLTLHLVARVHTSGGLPDPSESNVEIDKAYLYRSILSETASRQTEQTGGEGRLDPEKSRAFLRDVAWLMYLRSVDALDVSEVVPLLEAEGDGSNAMDPAQVAELAVLNAPELSKGEETGFEFVHKSFSEFLIAEVIAERVERAAFEVQEFGSDEPAWRMSDDEAAGLLASIFAQRLLPAEVQEMLEPMLGGVLIFRKGRRVEDRVPAVERLPRLDAIIKRCEALYRKGLTGIDFPQLERALAEVLAKPTPIEGLANYVAGLALVGTAAAAQATRDGRSARWFDGEQRSGCMWRFLSICHAGGVTLDESLSRRLTKAMSVGNSDTRLADTGIPWRLTHLHGLDGFDVIIQPAAELAGRELEILLALVDVLLDEADIERATPFARVRGREYVEFTSQSHLESLLAALASNGYIGGMRNHYFHARPPHRVSGLRSAGPRADRLRALLNMTAEDLETGAAYRSYPLLELIRTVVEDLMRRGRQARLFRAPPGD